MSIPRMNESDREMIKRIFPCLQNNEEINFEENEILKNSNIISGSSYK